MTDPNVRERKKDFLILPIAFLPTGKTYINKFTRNLCYRLIYLAEFICKY